MRAESCSSTIWRGLSCKNYDVVRFFDSATAVYLRRDYLQGALIAPNEENDGGYTMTLFVGQGEQHLLCSFANMQEAQAALRAEFPDWVQ